MYIGYIENDEEDNITSKTYEDINKAMGKLTAQKLSDSRFARGKILERGYPILHWWVVKKNYPR